MNKQEKPSGFDLEEQQRADHFSRQGIIWEAGRVYKDMSIAVLVATGVGVAARETILPFR